MKNRNWFSSLIILSLAFAPAVLLAVPPAAPNGLRAWPESESTVQLDWTDVADNEEAYEVHRRTGREGGWEVVAEGLAPDTTSFADQGLEPETEYLYRVIARNTDGSAASNMARAITDNRPFGDRSLSFQEGLGTYAGTLDFGIQETNPIGNTTGDYIWVDNNGAGDNNQVLLRFDDIFGEEPDQIPSGSPIERAILRIYLGTNSNSQATKPIYFHRMLVPWDGATGWGSAVIGGDGVQPDGIDAAETRDGLIIPAQQDYYYEIDVTPSLAAWSAGESIHGWVILSDWSDGYAYYSSQNPIDQYRPELIVTFDSDPANTAPVVNMEPGVESGTTGVHEPALLAAEVSDPDGDLLDVTFFGRKAPHTDEDPFSVVLLPDTQYYAEESHGARAAIFVSQTQWVVENREERNISFVLHMGDIVDNGDIVGGSENSKEWGNAISALYRLHNPITTGLEDGIPLALAVGNHDQEPIWRSTGTTIFFNRYFGVEHFERFSYYGGNYGENNDNHYHLMKAGGYDFIVISLEYTDPARDPIDTGLLEWVDNLLKTYPDHRGIIISHHMVNPGYPASWSPYGEAMYEVLKDNPNLHLMLGGHVTGEGLRIETYGDNTVYAIVQDYQGLPEGGAGFLRIMEFLPKENEIRFETYSPWKDAFLDDFGGEMRLPYDLGTVHDPFTALASMENVNSGTLVEYPWNTLDPETEYEWFVEASDGRKFTQGDEATFYSSVRTYSSWSSDYFTAEDPDSAPTEDPDSDGNTNFIEFVFQGNPLVPGALEVPLKALSSSDGQVELTYQRLKDIGLEWDYAFSADLSSWNDPATAGVVLEEAVTDHGNGLETVNLQFEEPAAARLFWRITARPTAK